MGTENRVSRLKPETCLDCINFFRIVKFIGFCMTNQVDINLDYDGREPMPLRCTQGIDKQALREITGRSGAEYVIRDYLAGLKAEN